MTGPRYRLWWGAEHQDNKALKCLGRPFTGYPQASQAMRWMLEWAEPYLNHRTFSRN